MTERGVLREIPDPQAEVMRLSRQRQVSAGQICAEEDRACSENCAFGPAHCAEWHARPARRLHDAAHCDRAWKAATDG